MRACVRESRVRRGNSGVVRAAVMAERPVRGDDGRAARLGACGVRELRQSAAAGGHGQQRRDHARGVRV